MRINQKYIMSLLSILLTMTVAAQDEKTNGNIVLLMGANDSMHVVTATVTNSETKTPLKDVELSFYIQRSFGLMQVGDGTTDTAGIASAEFPLDLPASDKSNKIILMAKVEDSDVMNDDSTITTFLSRIPFPADKPIPRSIAGALAPWWLVITFTLIVGTVGLLFVYVLYLVYRIKKSSTMKIISSSKNKMS